MPNKILIHRATCLQAERTVMLVNCGACEDVRAMLELPDAVRVIVIDAHRPIHHSYNDDADTDTLFLHDATDGTAAEDIPLASDSESSSDSGNLVSDQQMVPLFHEHCYMLFESGRPTTSQAPMTHHYGRRFSSLVTYSHVR